MNKLTRLLSGALAAAPLIIAPLAGMAGTQIVSHSKSVVVVEPTSFPEPLQQRGIAFQLYSGSGDGRCYLYIEQGQGERLLVLDVTDPARVKLVDTVSLNAPGPFDFVSTDEKTLLIRFRNNLGMAVIDVRKPRSPALKETNLHDAGRTEALGNSALLIVNEHGMLAPEAPQDYQVVDTSNPTGPTLLYTVKQVNSYATRDETGTTFLLGANGLTIIRRPRQEESYKTAENVF